MILVAVPAILRVNVKPEKRRYLYNVTVICICTNIVLNWLLAYRTASETFIFTIPDYRKSLKI